MLDKKFFFNNKMSDLPSESAAFLMAEFLQFISIDFNWKLALVAFLVDRLSNALYFPIIVRYRYHNEYMMNFAWDDSVLVVPIC